MFRQINHDLTREVKSCSNSPRKMEKNKITLYSKTGDKEEDEVSLRFAPNNERWG